MTDSQIIPHEPNADPGLMTVNPRPMALLQDAIRRGADIGVIERISALAEQWQKREAEVQFNEAFNECQGEMEPVLRDAPSEKGGKYASLEKIATTIRPIVTKHGFGTSYTEIFDKDVPTDNCRIQLSLRHRSGHTITCTSDFALDMAGPQGKANKTEIQGKGSCISYARRYLLAMAFDLIIVKELPKPLQQPEDDPDAPRTPTREDRQREAESEKTREPRVTGAQVVSVRDAWMKYANIVAPKDEAEKAELIEAFKYFVDVSLGYTQPSDRNWLNASAWEQQSWVATCLEKCK